VVGAFGAALPQEAVESHPFLVEWHPAGPSSTRAGAGLGESKGDEGRREERLEWMRARPR